MYVFWSILFHVPSPPVGTRWIPVWSVFNYDKWCRDIVCFYKVCHLMHHLCSQFAGSFTVVKVVALKDQPNLAFMNFLDLSNETLNEPLRSLGALNSRKLWIMGWTMGPERAYPKSLIFCNKYMSSFFTSSLRSSIGMCCSVIVKSLPLYIDFSTPSLIFPSKVNHSPKEDLESLSNGLECSFSFLWNAQK